MLIIQKFIKHFYNLSWYGVGFILLLHISLSFGALYYADETELIDNFIYYYVVTASTVGYGDFSPSSDLGKYIVSFIIIPGGIAIFTTVLGKSITTINKRISKMKNGMGNFYNRSKHVVVVGYASGETEKLFHETNQKLGKTEKIVITTDTVCNLDSWVHATSYSDKDAYMRANIADSSHVVIMLDDDDKTLTAIMSINSVWLNKTIIAYINDSEKANLVRHNFPNVECIVSNKINSVARSMADPGISKVFEALLSSHNSDTLYAYDIETTNDKCFGKTVDYVEKKFNCSVIAVETNGTVEFINNNHTKKLDTSDRLFYISKYRI
jgi:voltage-gated potassium channel